LGFPVVVSSHSERVVEAACEEWGAWQQSFDDPPIEVTFHGLAGDSARPPASVFRADRHLFAVAADAHNFAAGDMRARFAAAWLTAGAVADRAYLIYHFLDAITYPLITSLNFTPIHAGCVARDGRAVLIAGDSGGGKSSLSYACARQGWTFVSDDASPLLRRCAATRRIVGGPHHIRFRPDASQLFPELAAFQPAMRGNGKLSLQIPTRDLPIVTAPTAFADAIVLPRRVSREHASSPARLTRISKELVREQFEKWFYHWDPPIHAEQQAAFEELLAGVQTFELEYSDLETAVEVLHDAL